MSLISSDLTKKNRIIGYDLVRTLSFIAIAFQHFTAKLWKLPLFTPFAEVFFPWKIFETYAHLISFSGQTILFLTSFLIAMTSVSHKKAIKIIPILLALWVVSSLFDYEKDTLLLSWDIFPLIALGLAFSVMTYKWMPRAIYFLPFLGFVLICIPFWKFESLQQLPLFLRQMIVGDCSLDLSDWPILPWVGLVFWGYGLGYWTKTLGQQPLHFIKNEKLFWTLMMIWTPFYWGAYYRMKLGTQFSCEGMRQEPIAFLAHLFPVMFILRISLLEKVQDFLKSIKLFTLLSNLELNKNFGAAYFLHFFIIDLVIYFQEKNMINSPELSAFVAISLLPITEISLRLLKKSYFWIEASIVIPNK